MPLSHKFARPLFEGLLPKAIALTWGDIGTLQQPVFPEERAFIKEAVGKRQREFIAGRVLARSAQEGLGYKAGPLINDEDRVPQWSAEICGSISHTSDICGVAVGVRQHIRSVGLDIETIGRVTPDLWRQLFTEREIGMLRKLGDAERALVSTRLFSVKESFYKLQYPLTRQWVGFRDAEVELLGETGFCITSAVALSGVPASCRGLLTRPTADTVASLLYLPA